MKKAIANYIERKGLNRAYYGSLFTNWGLGIGIGAPLCGYYDWRAVSMVGFALFTCSVFLLPQQFSPSKNNANPTH
jgi:hypothetical protein